MKKFIITTLALSVLALNACKKDDNDSKPKDTAKPAITLTTPTTGAEIVSGNAIVVAGKITDDTELSQYKIEIHDDFDGHTHLKTGSPTFKFDTIVNISGKEALLNLTINTPVDVAAGPYHFIINALDKAGNEAPFAEADITIKNAMDSVAPTLSVVTTPSPSGGEIHLHGTATTITLVCTAGDNQSLKSYEIKLINKDTKVNYLDKDGNISGTSVSFNETVTFNTAWPDGEYVLVVEVFDLKNNATEVEFDVHREK